MAPWGSYISRYIAGPAPEEPIATLKIKVQLLCADEIAMGPGKAALLGAIGETGSISGAARALGMSYRRAWVLVDTMNRCFAEPLVETATGRGAWVTPAGAAVLGDYRALERAALAGAQGAPLDRLRAAIKGSPRTRT